MNKLLTAIILLFAGSALAANTERISLTVTVTNPAVTADVMVVNGAWRYWTNAHSSTTILTNLVSKNASATNLFNNYATYPLGSGIALQWLTTNSFRFLGTFGGAMSGSATGTWATLTLATQSGPSTFTALYPMENMVGETNRTNQGSSLVYGMGIYSTIAFPTNATALSNHITKGTAAGGVQTVASSLTVAGALRAMAQLFATNGYTSGLTNINPVSSNGVNYGAAFSSPGDFAGSQRFGSGGSADTGGNATIVGTSAAAATNGAAFGWFASAGYFGIAIGASADGGASTNSIAIGRNSNIGASSNAVALGDGVNIGDRHHNSIAIGAGAVSTTNNQVILGASTHTVIVPGMITGGTITNSVLTGTNRVSAIVVHTPVLNTALANGYNSGVAVNGSYIRFSGPSAAYTNVGFSAANKMDGKRALCQFDNPGLSFTLLHDSGLDAGDTNRIYTGTGALLNSTNNPVFAEIVYDNAVTRWRVVTFR